MSEAPTDTSNQVDVVIAAWNRAGSIDRAINSVIDEAAVRQVIVADDASTDGTAEIVATLARDQPKIRLIRSQVNQGPAAARNRAIDSGTAPWIAILDGDDYLEAGRLGRLLAASAHCDIVADDLIQVSDDIPRRTLLDLAEPRMIDLAAFIDGNINRRGAPRREMGFLKPILSRDFLNRHGLRYDPALRLGEDYVLYAQALAAGARFRLIPASGYVAVLRGDSLSARHSRRDLEALREADHRLLAQAPLSVAARAALRQHKAQLDGKIQWLEVIEAVKARDPVRFLRGCTLSPGVAAEIAGRLAEQAYLRTRAVLLGPAGITDGR
jgi:succinoglycan biosynthesis protein ExoU